MKKKNFRVERTSGDDILDALSLRLNQNLRTEKQIDDTVVNEEIYQLKKASINYNRLGFISKMGFSITNPNDYILITLDDLYK